jgi:flagellar capping protein FliD
MIDKQLIESAKIIRREFLTLSRNLDEYQDDVKNLGFFLQSKASELESYSEKNLKRLSSRDDLDKVVKHILSEVESIEEEEKKLSKKVSDINDKIEKLRKDEIKLYETIKHRYPSLSDDQISKEVQSQLDE